MVDVKKLVDALPKKKPDKGRVSIYVSLSVWEKFKKHTEKVGTSAVLEHLMEQAIQELERKK